MKIFNRSVKPDCSWIILIYTTLKPLYLSSSGTMQICDLFFAASVVYLLFRERGKLSFHGKMISVFKPMVLMVLYISAVNCIWFVITGDMGMIRVSFFYVFNMLAFFICSFSAKKVGLSKLKRSFAIGCLLSVLLTVFGLILYRGTRVRSTGFFNNPNQLGYYAIIIFSALFLWPTSFTKRERAIVAVISAWATLISGSKAAIIGLLVLVELNIVLMQKKITYKKLLFQIAAFLIFTIAVYVLLFGNTGFFASNPTILYVRRRLLRMFSENDSGFGSGRGYNRIFEMGIHFLWGMGEGAYDRFQTLTGLEIYSAYVSFLASYGAIGFLIICILMKKLLFQQGLTRRNLCCFSAIALYNLTHNGIRNTLLWIMLAIAFADSVYEQRKDMIEQSEDKETDENNIPYADKKE